MLMPDSLTLWAPPPLATSSGHLSAPGHLQVPPLGLWPPPGGRRERPLTAKAPVRAPIGVLFHKVRSCPRPHFFFLAAANTKLAASSASNLEPLRLQTLQRVVYDSIRLHMTHDDCRHLQSDFILYD